MPTQQTLNLNGETYFVLPKAEYERLTTLAKAAELPSWPTADAQGNMPAAEFVRASVAREIITRRSAVAWTQQQLADAAGVRVETVCRIETAKHAASTPTIESIDRALKSAEAKAKRKRK